MRTAVERELIRAVEDFPVDELPGSGIADTAGADSAKRKDNFGGLFSRIFTHDNLCGLGR